VEKKGDCGSLGIPWTVEERKPGVTFTLNKLNEQRVACQGQER